MSSVAPEPIIEKLRGLQPDRSDYATQFVRDVLAAAAARHASDLHLLPTADGLDVKWRLDGVLQSLGTFPAGTAANVVARIKVLADLLTYRTDIPQEGRIRLPELNGEMRVSTFPTLHGEKAVIRLFGSGAEYLHLADLGLPAAVQAGLARLLGETSGAVLVTGPAGSGKTTTLYACLRELVARSAGGRSIVTLEDPIEVPLASVAQSQVNLAAGFDLPTGLRSILRQDPEVIMVGEIRDRVTAEIAFQASLTGQLVLSSFHCGSAAAALSRLADMGLEPYVLRSGLLAIVSQRLVRRLCECARNTTDAGELLGLPLASARVKVGCPKCSETGYLGRFLLAELLPLDASELAQAILDRRDMHAIERLAVAAGMRPLWAHAIAAVRDGTTSPAEVRRVLGFSAEFGESAVL